MLAATLDALPAHIALLDPEGIIISVNESWRRFARANLLQAEQSGVGQDYLAISEGAVGECAESGSRAATGIREVLAGRRDSFSLEYPCHAPGQQRWFRLMVTPVRPGATGGAVVMHVDVTERQLAEQALVRAVEDQRQLAGQLAAERARLIEAQAVTKVGSWETDLVTLGVIWSEETYRIFGLDPATFRPTHESFLQCVHPADRPMVDAAFQVSFGTRAVSTVEHRVLLPDGTVKHVQERWRTYVDAAGAPLRAVGTCQDVTARHEAEAELERGQALLRVASKLSRLGAWSVDLATGTLRWSDEVRAIHEVEPGETPSLQEGIAFYAPEYRDHVRALFEACARDGTPYDAELQILTRGGRRVWVRAIGEAVRDAGGAIIEVRGAVQDITDRKRLEAQFLRAQRLESLGTLAGGIAHDLNNVLAPILASIALLRMDERDPSRLESLHTIESSAVRGAAMVKQVLSFAKGVEGTRQAVDLRILAGEVTKVIRETFPKDIAVHLEAADDLWSITGDPTQLHQVLMNLCVNARDAMPLGGTLTITLANTVLDEAQAAMEPLGHAGPFVTMRVADTGTGIPPEVMERLFEPFYTTKEPGKGTGLGLSTAHTIVRTHGGFFQVHSEPGKGARFSAHLPAEVTPPTAGAVEAAQAKLPRGRGELVLVVDDEESIRSVVRRTLERFGYRVMVAANGAEAVSVFARHWAEVAVVLTDMAMPVMDGPAMVVALRAIDPAVRVIGSSGLTSSEGMVGAIGAGVTDFVPKPYTAETLLSVLHRVLHEGG